jgi:FkbM family methyltransferase
MKLNLRDLHVFQDTYVKLTSRSSLGVRLNKYLFLLAARGLGILNFKSRSISGEQFIFDSVAEWKKGAEFVYVDVGANTGYHSHIPQVRGLLPDSKIFAIEPHPMNLELLQQHAKELGYTVLPYAVGSEPGTMKLYDTKMQDDEGRPHASFYEEAIQEKGEKYSVDVEVVTLDTLMKKQGITTIHMLNIDVEGHEFAVLQGGNEMLASGAIECIFMEFNSMNIVSKHSFRDFYELLHDNYLVMRVLPHNLLQLPKDSPLYTEIYAFQNLLFVHKNSSFIQTISPRILKL